MVTALWQLKEGCVMLLVCCVLVRLLKKENCNGMYLMRSSVNAESGKVCVCVYVRSM